MCLECHSNLPSPTLPANGTLGTVPPGVPRPAQPALPELHPLPSEGAWLLREPGLLQMRFLLALMLIGVAGAQTQAPAGRGPSRRRASRTTRQAPAPAAQPAQAPAKAEAEAGRIPRPFHRRLAHRQHRFRLPLADRCPRQFPGVPQRRQPGPGPQALRPGLHHSATPRSASSTAWTCAPTAGAAIPTTPPTWTPASRASTISPFDYRNIAYFNAVPSFANPLRAGRLQRAVLRHPPPQHQRQARPASRQAHHPLPGVRPQFRLRQRHRRPGCRMPTTSSPCPPCCATAPTTTAAACASSTTASTSPWSRAAPRSRTTTRPTDTGIEPRRQHHAAARPDAGPHQPEAGLRHPRHTASTARCCSPPARFPGSTSTASSCTASPRPRQLHRICHRQFRRAQLAAVLQRPADHRRPARPTSRTPPATSGSNCGPSARLRIIESWMTDRYHDAASPLVAEQLLLRAQHPGPDLLTSLNYGAGASTTTSSRSTCCSISPPRSPCAAATATCGAMPRSGRRAQPDRHPGPRPIEPQCRPRRA